MRYILIFLLIMPQIGYSRPISYPDGYTIMQQNNAQENRFHLHYSPDYKNSLGLYYEHEKDTEQDILGLQWNKLLGRVNEKHSQANLYLKNYAGYNFQTNNLEANIAITGDYETRRIFTSYMAKLKLHSLNDGEFEQAVTIGLAPYLGDYDDLHTWLMLQAKHQPEYEDNFILTPFVRLFYKDYLVELGVDENKKAMFNWIIRM